MIPITRKELYLNKIVGNNDYETPEKPITTEEFFFAEILGEAVQAPEPLTRYQKYLAKIAKKDVEIPYPETRLEYFLARAAGMDIKTPVPITKEEIYWSNYTAIVEFELEGVPPLTFSAKAGALINYRIYGNIEEVEVKTDMPLDLTQTTTVGAPAGMFTVSDDTVIVNGTPSSRYYALCQIPIFLDIAKYHISGCPAGGSSGTYRVDVRNSEGQQITSSIDTGSGFDISVNNAGTYYYTIRIQAGYSVDNKIFTPKIEKIETVIASVGDFVSSGEHAGEYLIPVTINSSTTDIYLSEPLAKSDYIDYKTQKRFNADGTSEDVTLPEISTIAGTTTLSVGTTIQPSKVYIKGEKERD